MTIVIVGRPNVGKSTLFNRLVGQRQAVVSSSPGTTRDRLYGLVEWRGVPLTLIDAGGMEFGVREDLAASVQRHVRRALQEADGVLFVCDAQEGPLPADHLILEVLRKTGKPITFAVNKVDQGLDVPPDFFSLGLPSPLAVSALHGRGIGELLEAIVEPRGGQRQGWDGRGRPAAPPSPVALAIIGRPNVGKSSILNALLREERAIVSEIPGTTRDAIDASVTIHGQIVRFVDTAGLRHRRKVKDPVDLFSMARTAEAIERCDVALVVLDTTQGITRDDRRILARVWTKGRGVVVVANKWDLVPGGSPRALSEALRRQLPLAPGAPVLVVSAKTGFQLPAVVPAALRVAHALRHGLSEADCAALLEAAWRSQPPPRVRGRAIHLRRVLWIPERPPRLELVTSPLGRLPIPYQRYLLKRLHAHPRLAGVPVALVVRGPLRPHPGSSHE